MMLANSSGSGIAGTLDSSYYKGQGERQGIEREYVVVRNNRRPSDTEDKRGSDFIHGEQQRL